MATSNSICSRAHTKVKLEKCSFVWVIDAFSHIGSKLLKSPAFSAVGGTLSFIVNVETLQLETDDNNQKPYINFSLTPNNLVLHCTCDFDFRKSDGTSIKKLSGSSSNKGQKTCMEKEAFTKNLINDVLEIHVRVTASASLETTAFLPTPSAEVPSTTTALFETKKFSDFVIRVQEIDIPVHKIFLSMKSPVFEAMLLHDTTETQLGVLELKDADLATTHAMVEFFYLDAVNTLDVALALDLLRVADKYNVVHLVRYCSSYLQENVCFSNAIDILVTASDSNASELKEFCFKYIDENESFKFDDEQKKKLEQQKDLLLEFFCRKH